MHLETAAQELSLTRKDLASEVENFKKLVDQLRGKIEGNKERDLKRIESEAYRIAEEIKGKADAEATDIYAKAFGVDADFYSFLKTMEVYRDTLGKDSTLVLSTDSDFLGYLKSLSNTPD